MQSVVLRGHGETAASKNKGNFLELMELDAKDSSLIKQFFNTVSLQQVAVVIRHVNDNLDIHKSFIGFYHSEKTDGESLAKLLKNVLTSLNLDVQNMRTQCYDGASNMLRLYKGVVAKIQREYPLSIEIAATDNTCGGKANTLLKCIDDFYFLFNFLLLRRVLSQCDILSKALQNGNVSYETVKYVANSTIDVLLSFRTDAFFTQLFNHCTDVAEDYGFQPAQLPRTGRTYKN
ncbi:hypothetical protein PR048_015714 [Dryococelus australis]|uniref:DUF4371 domain-containing protein n=1 Tax=Dryococelus australis TaxID=614101 RepID=A0ABQ9HHQ4_9NEOP|nr:hypothetical protein PR048_015714 [Dryococelus australis]